MKTATSVWIVEMKSPGSKSYFRLTYLTSKKAKERAKYFKAEAKKRGYNCPIRISEFGFKRYCKVKGKIYL